MNSEATLKLEKSLLDAIDHARAYGLREEALSLAMVLEMLRRRWTELRQ